MLERRLRRSEPRDFASRARTSACCTCVHHLAPEPRCTSASVPYLTEGSRVLLLTGVETSYEPVAEAAVAFAAEASTVTAKPFGVQAVRLPALRPRRPARSPWAAPPVPAAFGVGTGGPAGEAAVPAGVAPKKQGPPVPATSPAKSPRVAGSTESPRRVTLVQDDTDDEQELQTSGETFHGALCCILLATFWPTDGRAERAKAGCLARAARQARPATGA